MALSLTALAVITACSLAWSGVDLLRKLLVVQIKPLALVFLLSVGMLPFFAVWAGVDGRLGITAGYWLPALGSTVLNAVANVAFIESVRRSPLSVTIPLLSFTPVFVTLLGVPLGELPRPQQWIGVALVVLGALLLNLAPGQVSPLDLLRAFVREPGSPLMLLTAFLWSATVALDKLAIAHASEPLHAFILCAGLAAGTLVWLAVGRRLGDLAAVRKVSGAFVGALVVGGVALGLQLVALNLAFISVVETLKRGIGNIMAVIFGRALLGEQVTTARVAAVALMAAGVAVVMLG